MANELTINVTVDYADSIGQEESLQITDLLVSITNKAYTKVRQAITTSEVAIKMGDLTAPGYALFVNRDPTNYIDLRVGTAGSKFHRLYPGGISLGRMGPDAQTPYAIANTATCEMDIFIIGQ